MAGFSVTVTNAALENATLASGNASNIISLYVAPPDPSAAKQAVNDFVSVFNMHQNNIKNPDDTPAYI